MSAEYACGQILFNLRNSNLHYLLEETHKSAFITVRKKLIKDEPTSVIEHLNVDQEKKLNEKIRMENGLLKQEINDFRVKCANLEIEIEEKEVKNESLDE